MNLKQKVNAMLGKPYLFNGKNIVIENFSLETDKVVLITTNGYIDIKLADADTKLDQFLPSSNEMEVGNQQHLQMRDALNENFKTLNAILLDNIKQVKADPAYVGQANVVHKSVKAITDLTKVQLEIIKMSQPK